jgi:hypothetical protein
VFDRHAQALSGWALEATGDDEIGARVRMGMPMRIYAKPLAPAGLVDIRADLVDGNTATRQKRSRVWLRHAASAAVAGLVVFTHLHGWPPAGG